MDDCYYYYNATCTRGSSCAYRHEPLALNCDVVCLYWKRGHCNKSNCSFRHSELTSRRGQECYFESQPGGCQRSNCPYVHTGNSMEGARNGSPVQSIIVNKNKFDPSQVDKMDPLTAKKSVKSRLGQSQTGMNSSNEEEDQLTLLRSHALKSIDLRSRIRSPHNDDDDDNNDQEEEMSVERGLEVRVEFSEDEDFPAPKEDCEHEMSGMRALRELSNEDSATEETGCVEIKGGKKRDREKKLKKKKKKEEKRRKKDKKRSRSTSKEKRKLSGEKVKAEDSNSRDESHNTENKMQTKEEGPSESQSNGLMQRKRTLALSIHDEDRASRDRALRSIVDYLTPSKRRRQDETSLSCDKAKEGVEDTHATDQIYKEKCAVEEVGSGHTISSSEAHEKVEGVEKTIAETVDVIKQLDELLNE